MFGGWELGFFVAVPFLFERLLEADYFSLGLFGPFFLSPAFPRSHRRRFLPFFFLLLLFLLLKLFLHMLINQNFQYF